MLKGVLDRIEDGFAVILIEELKEEIIISEHNLPTGSKEGTWLIIEQNNDQFRIVKIDEEATRAAFEKSKSLREQLKEKKKGSRYKRK